MTLNLDVPVGDEGGLVDQEHVPNDGSPRRQPIDDSNGYVSICSSQNCENTLSLLAYLFYVDALSYYHAASEVHHIAS